MRDAVQRLARNLGYEVRRYRPHRDAFRRLQLALQRREVGVVLDVGANTGQFARALRAAGYGATIISFEPLSDAYAKLTAYAKRDPFWTIAPRSALGAKHGTIEINVSRNSQSSSILNVLERHVAADTKSAYIGKETVPVTTLDSFIDSKPELANTPIALKTDTQGYEAEVLHGLRKWSDRVEVIAAELSLTALYEGETTFAELFRMIQDRGYGCISIEPGFTDHRSYEVLQVDVIFERLGPVAGGPLKSDLRS
jgi:FkbM family methyltransferase